MPVLSFGVFRAVNLSNRKGHIDQRKLAHLTGAEQSGRDIDQISATLLTTMSPTLDGHGRLLAPVVACVSWRFFLVQGKLRQ